MSDTLAILADDLTGAADCAARSSATMAAAILLRPPTPPLPAAAIAFTSDSRHLGPEAAGRRVGELLSGLAYLAGVTWYKKIDSTLRGNLGAELDAMLDALDRSRALICPAFPAQGRGLREGWLVSSTAPPVHLPALLAQQSRRAVATISLTDVRAGGARLHERLAASQAGLLVVDALTDDDLRAIVEAAARAIPTALLCGSAGMVGALAERWSTRADDRSVSGPAIPPLRPGPALLVVGSGSTVAHAQLGYLRRQGLVAVVEAGGPAQYQQDGDVALHLPPPPPGAMLDGVDARAQAATLAGAAQAAIEQRQPALLVLVGGDTAIGVLERLGLWRLDVARELLPGMPLAYGMDRSGRGYHVVLKAGNHGGEDALATVLALARSPDQGGESRV